MKKLPIEKFEELLTKSNIEHKVNKEGDPLNNVDLTVNSVELDVFGLNMYVTNANPLKDEKIERLMVHVGYPKPVELMTFIFLLKIVELKCVIDGITFEDLSLEELERRGLISND